MHLVLEYALTDDYLERRAALRDEHLSLAQEAHDRGELLLAGGDTPPVWPATTTQTYEADPVPFVRERYAEVRDLTAARKTY